MRPNFNHICSKLQEKAYKITPQRQTILKAFFDHNQQHLSAEEVYAIAKKQCPEIGLATVYRTLEIFANLDILHKIDFGDGCTRYEFVEEETHHHHHLICVKCGKVMEVNNDLLDVLESWITQNTGFQVINHQLKFYGYCKKCSQDCDNLNTKSK